MIRGHIDFVSRDRVEGWIASERLRLTGAKVLAFVDETCVGGGTVDIFRQDLADAGLGDGVVGFRIPIALEPGQDVKVLDVRLDGGSVLLKQSRSCLVPREAVGEDRRRQGRDPASLSWMLARGWLSQAHYDALRLLSQFGVYGQKLAPSALRDPLARCDEMALAAADLIELHMLQPVELEIREGVRPADLADIRREVRVAFPFVPPVIGLWAPKLRQIDVVEGAHRHGPPTQAGGAVEYAFGDRNLLLVDLDGELSFANVGGMADQAFAAFVPSPPQF